MGFCVARTMKGLGSGKVDHDAGAVTCPDGALGHHRAALGLHVNEPGARKPDQRLAHGLPRHAMRERNVLLRQAQPGLDLERHDGTAKLRLDALGRRPCSHVGADHDFSPS